MHEPSGDICHLLGSTEGQPLEGGGTMEKNAIGGSQKCPSLILWVLLDVPLQSKQHQHNLQADSTPTAAAPQQQSGGKDGTTGL